MQSSSVPFYLPIRSKYMPIELLTFLFIYKCEACCFLRKLSRKSFQFYTKYQDEICQLFEVYTITLKPPLKFENTGEKWDLI